MWATNCIRLTESGPSSGRWNRPHALPELAEERQRQKRADRNRRIKAKRKRKKKRPEADTAVTLATAGPSRSAAKEGAPSSWSDLDSAYTEQSPDRPCPPESADSVKVVRRLLDTSICPSDGDEEQVLGTSAQTDGGVGLEVPRERSATLPSAVEETVLGTPAPTNGGPSWEAPSTPSAPPLPDGGEP
ncbi:hypothetical protein THAOC_16849 [Thalassiosira oceanica]|uniref:Uncharacterized protein n=1 Tax=Thalassiosira oceanica TaxID=159749 RepID=K0SC69_THAOC|nr:hypothetical protein THAOC_16849 [Thalassiosira oceanica]|eukprot:EJK62539.1 hypothetical protein THAOC_16849 [Thalassiosira oceanica]